MHNRFAVLHTVCAIAFVTCAAPAIAQHHTVRIDSGNGTTGCMSTWDPISDAAGAGAFSPVGSFETVVACTPISGSPSDLFPEGVATNEAYTATNVSSYEATGGEMFQYFTGGTAQFPDAEVVLWNLGNSDTEVEMNGWCVPNTGSGSFSYGGASFSGGCGANTSTDFLFNSSKGYIGYVDQTTGALALTSTVPTGWTTTGGSGGKVTAPEIDPSSAIAALTLLAGAIVVLSDRRRLTGR